MHIRGWGADGLGDGGRDATDGWEGWAGAGS